MKSSRVHSAIVIAIICVIAVAALQFHTQHQNVLRTQIMYIGRDLVQKTNSASLVNVGPGLRQKLAELLSSEAHVSKVLLGDEPALGDGTATGRLILTNTKGAAIGIRLRRDHSAGGKFHILGFWTIYEDDPTLSAPNEK